MLQTTKTFCQLACSIFLLFIVFSCSEREVNPTLNERAENKIVAKWILNSNFPVSIAPQSNKQKLKNRAPVFNLNFSVTTIAKTENSIEFLRSGTYLISLNNETVSGNYTLIDDNTIFLENHKVTLKVNENTDRILKFTSIDDLGNKTEVSSVKAEVIGENDNTLRLCRKWKLDVEHYNQQMREYTKKFPAEGDMQFYGELTIELSKYGTYFVTQIEKGETDSFTSNWKWYSTNPLVFTYWDGEEPNLEEKPFVECVKLSATELETKEDYGYSSPYFIHSRFYIVK